ncbi:MAG: hypothetical protein PVF74_06035 [Anaerolineales bacterium]|jgi:hypothetical protein
MPGIIDPGTINVDDLPAIWSPVQWELSPEEHAQELEQQAQASLQWVLDAPEVILRLLLDETAIERAYVPPPGYDPEQQGDWDEELVTFQFARTMRLERIERESDYLYLEYDFGNRGHWAIEIEPEKVTIERI